MECPKCHVPISGRTKFCPNCGNEIVQPSPTTEKVGFWQKNLALIGAALGFGSGLIALIGWFSPWTSVGFGNGPQLVILPFGLGAGSQLLSGLSGVSSFIPSLYQITGWIVLIAIIMAAISIVLLIMALLSIWTGVKCLEYRSDVALLSQIKLQINKLRTYGLVGLIFVIVIMTVASIFQVGKSVIGGGTIAMLFGFLVAFVSVIYLKPHLR